MNYSLLNLGELLSIVKDIALPSNVAQIVPKDLVLDSRQVSRGDVFVALVGTQIDGRKFIQQAIDQGAVAVLSHADNYKGVKIQHGVAVVEIPNLLKRISEVAARFYGYPANNLTTFGVTGTNGKTTCAHLYAQAKTLLGQSCGVIGTTGVGVFGEVLTTNGFTTPDAITTQKTIRSMVDDITCLSLEVSSHSLDQFRVDSLNFTCAAFTNLSRDHLDYHGSMAAYGESKKRLFARDELRNAIINVDDEFGTAIVDEWDFPASLIRYSLIRSDVEISVKNIHFSISGISADIHTPWGKGQINTRLIGEFNLSNLLAVIGALLSENINFDELLEIVPKLKPVAGRMQIIDSLQKMTSVVVDYAHTPDGLDKALSALRKHCQGNLICVFGCGGNRDRGKRPLMAKAVEAHSDKVFVTNDNPRFEDPKIIADDIMTGFSQPERVTVELDRTHAIGEAISQASNDDIVLIAGKGHEDYQIIGDQNVHHDDAQVAHSFLSKKAASC